MARGSVHGRGLDYRDRVILNELFGNARTPISGPDGIAARAGLANHPCRKRIERLEREGYIRGYTVKIGLNRTRFRGFCYLFIGLINSSKDRAREMSDYICNENNVIMCDLITGKYDLLIKIGFHDLDEFNRTHERITSHPLCNDVETQFFLESRREHHFDVTQVE